jgi:hypothetical protein
MIQVTADFMAANFYDEEHPDQVLGVQLCLISLHL